jgi:hypothetical protein
VFDDANLPKALVLRPTPTPAHTTPTSKVLSSSRATGPLHMPYTPGPMEHRHWNGEADFEQAVLDFHRQEASISRLALTSAVDLSGVRPPGCAQEQHGPLPPAPWARLPTKAADSDALVALGLAQTLPVGWLLIVVIVVQSGPFRAPIKNIRCTPQLWRRREAQYRHIGWSAGLRHLPKQSRVAVK